VVGPEAPRWVQGAKLREAEEFLHVTGVVVFLKNFFLDNEHVKNMQKEIKKKGGGARNWICL
jgi:hypothetical protein